MDRHRPLSLALLLGWVVWGGDGAALAEPGAPAGEAAAKAPATEPVATVRVVLWLDAVADAGFAERVAGQTSDLPVSLQIVPRASLPPSETIAVAEAERIARETGAAGVAWCTRPRPGADRLTLHLVATEGHRLLVRELGDGRPVSDGDVSSATLETAALVLREALRALAEGAPIGEPVVREPNAEAPPVATATAPARPAPAAARAPTLHAALGWATSLDGVAPFGHQGPELGLGVESARAGFELSVTPTLPVRATDELATIRLLRPSLALRGGVRIRATGRLAWEPGLRLGVVAYRRTTEPGAEGMDPTGARTIVSPLFGPESRVGVRLVGATELALAVGFEVVPRVPEIGYEIAGELRPVLRPWQLQPRIALSLGAGKSAGR